MAVTEGDLVVIVYPIPDGMVGPAPTVLGVDREGNTVDIKDGTHGIAYKFEHERDRRWWVFLSTGKKVSVNAKTVRSIAHAGNPGNP